MATWAQLGFLSGAQQTKAAEFAALGASITNTNRDPPVGSLTYSQAKAAENKFRELMDLVGPAMRGVAYARKKLEEAAVKAFQDANP